MKVAGIRLSSCANAGLAGSTIAASISHQPIRERILVLAFIHVPPLRKWTLSDLQSTPGNTAIHPNDHELIHILE
jgi:hypothetical protein